MRPNLAEQAMLLDLAARVARDGYETVLSQANRIEAVYLRAAKAHVRDGTDKDVSFELLRQHRNA